MVRLVLAAALAPALLPGADRTALDRYVEAPDPAFGYEIAARLAAPGGATVFVLDMVSQRWLTEAEVDRPEWRHWLLVVKPARVTSSTALLVISGGSNNDGTPTPDPALLAAAADSGAVVAELRMVPNQPLVFAGETAPRSEDALIAWSWRRYLETGDERWPARLPMTKSAVRAMDAVTALLASEAGEGLDVRRFVVTGGSKRGWTAWTTAAVDRRVVAIAPLVIDALNLEPSFIHHWRAYGFWAPAIGDYVAVDLMRWLGTPEFHALAEIEDPYEYRERLTLSKFLVNSTGDQFFLPDSSQFYFQDLPGEKYLRSVPNTDHSLDGSDALESLVAWFQAILTCTPRPRFYWRADREAGSIRLRVVDVPSEVRLWQATNPAARDFRLMTIGKAWTGSVVRGENGIYDVAVPAPERGWTAFFLELSYPGPGRYRLKFTTETVVTPDSYPFAPPPAASLSLRPRVSSR